MLDIAPMSTQLAIGATGADVLLAVERMGEARVAGSIAMRAIESAKEELLARIDKVVDALKPYGVARSKTLRLAVCER